MAYIGNEPIVSATRTVTEVSATAGQTVFYPNGGYTVGKIDVIVNGSQLQSSDFTATNGSSVTLTTACNLGDDVKLVAWGVFSSSNVTPSSLSTGGPYWDTSSNLGIGTTSPTAKLHLYGATVQALVERTTSDSAGYRGKTTLGDFTWGVGIGTATNCWNVYDGTAGAERMRIDSSGNLLVGQTSKNANAIGAYIAGTGDSQTGQVSSCLASSTSANASYTLYSTGASAYRFYVTMDGKINCTSTTIAGISDQRLKENVRTLDAGLNEILELKPRRFDWKEGKGKNIKNDLGFIAQEFETVFPEMIGRWIDETPEGEEPYKSISPDLIPVLVKAIQEQQAIITDLKARIETLEGAKIV